MFKRDLLISAGALAALAILFAVTNVRADATISRGSVKVGDNAATDTSYDAIVWLLGDSASGFRVVIDAANTYFGIEREFFGFQTTPAIAVERSTGKVGLGLSGPKNQLDVEGAAVIGATFSGTNTAPSNGLLVEGSVGIGRTDASTKLHLSVGNVDGIRISSTNSGFLQLFGGTSNVNWAFANDYNASGIFELLVGTAGADPTTSRLRVTSSGDFAFGNFAPLSRVHVPDGAYLQAADNNAGAPPNADCDDDSERGRLSIDTTSNRLYVCNGTARGWDYVALTD